MISANVEDTLKKYKKIPIHVVEEHNDALKFIYSAIGAKRLPVEGNTLVHLDAHPDLLISRSLKGSEARSGRQLLPLLEIENWIVPAAAAGHIGRVVWLRPPWATQMKDGTRSILVGDHPTTGLLRVNSKEPYFLSDALYSKTLINEHEFILTVAELGDPDSQRHNEEKHTRELSQNLEIASPYVLDIDLDFFSTDNPFLSLYDNIGLYDRLEDIFNFDFPDNIADEAFEKVVEFRDKQLQELEKIFLFLEERQSLEGWDGMKTELYFKVSQLVDILKSETASVDEPVDWWAVYAAGCTRDQGGLPHHISSRQQINSLISRSLRALLRGLPPPVLITISRSAEDGYCPKDQVDEIQALVIEEIKKHYDTEDPHLYYLDS